MALTTGNDYDHIDISDGTNTTRHYLKDTVARDDLIKAQSSQPSESGNKIWFPDTTPEGVEVPTYAEFSDLRSAINYSVGTRLVDFVQGSIGSPSGNELNVNTFSRSDFFDIDCLLYIDKPTPIRCLVCYYDSTKTMLGRQDYALSSAAVIYRNDILALNGATKYVRFVVGINGQNTSPEDVVASAINIMLSMDVRKEIDKASDSIMNVLGNDSVQSYYEQTAITVSSGKELTKLYPTADTTYNIYAFGLNNCELRLFEFYTGGSYSTLAKLSNNENYHYVPGENVDYLRIYLAVLDNTRQISGKAVVLNYEGIMSNDTASDYLLSKEFAAVRKFTVIGDSLASGYYKESSSGTQYPKNVQYSWPQIMAKMYGQTAQNASHSGATCATWWADANDDCKAMVSADNLSQVYIMALGTNDYKDVADADITAEQIGSSADIDTSDYTRNADSFWGNYCKILQYIHTIAPSAKVICCTIPQPRPNTAWKQTAIREICAYSLFTDYVVLCDLEKAYNDLSNTKAMQAEMWQGHFTPVGYANSAEFLMYAFSKTIQANLTMFVNLPQIPFDTPVSEQGINNVLTANINSAVDITANTTYIDVVDGKYVEVGNYVYFNMLIKYVHAISSSLSNAITNLPQPVYDNFEYEEYGDTNIPTSGVLNHTNGWRIVGAHSIGDVRRIYGKYLKASN